jgi:nucleoside-diphosphate-sugar epimerase
VRLLVLGGTTYLGRHLVEHALAAGHHVTLFNRGRTRTDLFPGTPRLIGDRSAGELAALAGGAWDGVFDFSGFRPEQVEATARLLSPRVGHYTFMSSIAVYPRSPLAGRTETAETRKLPSDDTYGPWKAECERVAEAACPGRSTSIRAGLIIGPGDPFGAFPSWALAMAGDGPVPCAARPEQPVQTTDVRDLVAFMVRTVTEPLPGIFTVVDPPMTFARMLEACRVAGGGSARVRWNARENVDEHGAFIVQPRDGSDDGAFLLAGEKARAAGYRARPFAETARDTIEWARRTRPTFTSPH